MPFDPMPVERIATADEFAQADIPTRLRMLSYALRHLPDNHRWDFTYVGGRTKDGCGSAGCALGLADRLWGRDARRSLEYHQTAYVLFGITPRDSFMLYGTYSREGVTAEQVADKVDEFVANNSWGREARARYLGWLDFE